MGYEIPQNLKYEEKIIFGLTFKQVFWLALFLGIGGAVFMKTNLQFEIKIIIAVIFSFFGAGFAFFGFWNYIANFLNYRKSIKEAGFFDAKMQKFTDVKKIEGGVVYLNDNSIRGIIQIRPINFKMLSKMEQNAIISAYRDFLNSLDFPVQVVMRTVNLDIDDYLISLEGTVRKENSEEMLVQFESFRDFTRQYIESNCVKDRLFYIVIPYCPDGRVNLLKDFSTTLKNIFSKEKQGTSREINRNIALNAIDVRIRLCLEKLKRCNLSGKKLNTNELIALLASFFDRFVETKGEYTFFLTLLKNFSGQKESRKFLDIEGRVAGAGGDEFGG